MTCPSCAASAADGAVECPSCGVIFAKWKSRTDAPAVPAPPAAASSGRGALMLGALVLSGAGVWFARSGRTAQPPAPAAVEAAVPTAESPAEPAADGGAAVKECITAALQLVESARAETAGFGDGAVTLAQQTPEALERLDRWRAWAPQWKARAEGAKSCMPASAKGVPAFEAVKLWADGGFEMLAQPPNPGAGAFLAESDPAFSALYLPGKSQREGWLNTTKYRFEKALSLVGAASNTRTDL